MFLDAFIGEVEGKNCILIDDICDTAGTLTNASKALKEKKAKTVFAYITHGVLSGGAVSRITSSALQELAITDSIQGTDQVIDASNIRHISIAPILAEAMKRIHDEQSVSCLFD